MIVFVLTTCRFRIFFPFKIYLERLKVIYFQSCGQSKSVWFVKKPQSECVFKGLKYTLGTL